MNEKRIVRRSRDELRRGKTDIERLKKMTDAEIDTAIARDPDVMPADVDWSDAELVYPPKKEPVSIRLDEDVLDFFRSGGRGYQTRINAVLRQFMSHQKEKKAG